MSSINPSTKNQKVVHCRPWQSPVTPQNSNHQLAIINFARNKRRKTPKKYKIQNRKSTTLVILTQQQQKQLNKRQISHRTTNLNHKESNDAPHALCDSDASRPRRRPPAELSVLERRGIMESGTKRRVGTHTRFIQGGHEKWMKNG